MRTAPAFVCAAALLLAACGSSTHTSAPPATAPPASRATTPTTAGSTRPRTTTPNTTAPAPNLATLHVGLVSVASGLNSPVALAWRKNDSKMYVAEQGG